MALEAKPPNIVFFFTDDQTTDTIGCYGNDIVRTPNLDGLAARGTRFDRAYVSHPICWVSRTTILSGLYGRSFGTASNPDAARPDAVETLYSDHLREAGYRTGYIGKWHAKMPRGWKREAHFDVFQAIGRNPFYKRQPDGSLRHETELIVDGGIAFIKNQPKDKPFALNLWFNACHAEDGDRRPGVGHFPWPIAVDGMYDDVAIPPPRLNNPKTFDELPDFLRTTITRERFFWRWNTPDKYASNMRAYYRMVSGIDGAIGRFMRALEDAGLADNTIIVYSADNGYHMGNRGLAGKWSHYEESIRVPMIVMDPRVPASERGKVTKAPALNVDLPATFLDWAGVDIPERYQGHSLDPIVRGAVPDDWRRETFHEHFAVRNRIPAFEGVRNDRYKYVRYFDHDKEFLHDMRKDPDELVNLANDPKHAKVLAEMRERTVARVNELGGPLDPLKGAFTKSTDPHPEASAARSSGRPNAEGFSRIFDGKSLRGWWHDPKIWKVKDGAITGISDGSLQRNRFITWKASTIQNFDLRLKVKISEAGNSGIQFRSQMRPDLAAKDNPSYADVMGGYQCDVSTAKPQYNGMLYWEKGRKNLSNSGEKVVVDADDRRWKVGDLGFKEFAPGEWHEYRILARGNHIQQWIDGHMTADVIDLAPGRALDGVLGFQLHRGPPMKVQFKDIFIKHLPDNLPLKKADEVVIPDDATQVKPLGRLPDDWKPEVFKDRKPARPNVLFISIDDLNDWIGCLNGHPQALTPNMDRLAKRGVLFRNAHCASPACNPSRAAVWSGQHPDKTGVWSNSSPGLFKQRPDHMTMTGPFKAAGYQTLGAGKLLHKDGKKLFDDYYGTGQRWSPLPSGKVLYKKSELPSKGTDDPRKTVNYKDRTWVLPLNRMPSDRKPNEKAGESFDWGAFDVPDEWFGDTKITDWAIEKLSGAEEGDLQFLGVGYYRPHIPLWAPKRFFERFENTEGKLPPVKADDLDDLSEAGKQIALEPLTAGSHATVFRFGQWDEAIEGYLASTTYVDEEIGRLLDALDASAQADNTVIVLWSDHGWHLGEKQHWGKWTGWERSTKVPLMIVPPRHRAAEFAGGSVCDQPVSLLDLYPTLMELCRLQAPLGLDGESLVPLLQRPKRKTNRKIITTFSQGNLAVRDVRYRYIRYEDGSEELYDMKTDPNEWSNIVGDAEEITRAMRAHAETFNHR